MNHRLLGRDEERILIQRAQSGDQASLDELVICNQRFVQKIASGYMRSGMAWVHVDTEDLVQWGNEGLIEAIHRFDLRSDYRLTTYAWWWIRAIMRRYLLRHGGQHTDGLHVLEDHATIRRKRNALVQELHRDPTPEEVQLACGKRMQTVRDAMSMTTVLSLDYESNKEDEIGLSERVPASDCNVPELAGKRIDSENIRDALDELPPRQKLVLMMRFGFDNSTTLTLQEVGQKLGVSRERARQIEKTAMQSLKKSLSKSFYMQEM